MIIENVDRLNIFLEIRVRFLNIKKFEKYDDLIEFVILELREKRFLFFVIIMYVDNFEALGYFF